MRIAGTLIFILLFTNVVLAQDSTQISYSEIQDTLVKQRFIDRYENVFMTKVPTRHMFKVGISQYYQATPFPLYNEMPFTNLSLHLGYEFKFLPAFSIALSGHIPNYGTSAPLRYAWSSTVLDAQLRWFVDMKRRIRKGKSANNFSGNYAALFYNLPGTYDYREIVGLKLGLQRRFLNSGFMDFAIALEHEIQGGNSISTQASFGFAFGDWKKAKSAPICDILFCDENIQEQWKIKLPELTFGYYLNRIRAGVAYERKVKETPFSLNFQLDLGVNKGFNYISRKNLADFTPEYYPYSYKLTFSKEFFSSFSIQPRYYFLQKRQQTRGRTSNGLSSFYTGINFENNFYIGDHGDLSYMRGKAIVKQNTLHIGPMIGFQQRVFKNGYIDLNTSYNYKREFYNDQNSFGFRGNLSVGLAF
ncbi:hypothetical protein [Dyadobacter sp. CY312]|uniref:hypothetical protein n=1 Tax=Dyadobacter sp. CY312 TaxID=2907303 RepID=UPI001F18770F|nr:hypothetical protein [Dyadobacter sp. CY312]MCE7043001.1 hypothetical protein [Dyadobacter sp. CY312]